MNYSPSSSPNLIIRTMERSRRKPRTYNTLSPHNLASHSGYNTEDTDMQYRLKNQSELAQEFDQIMGEMDSDGNLSEVQEMNEMEEDQVLDSIRQKMKDDQEEEKEGEDDSFEEEKEPKNEDLIGDLTNIIKEPEKRKVEDEREVKHSHMCPICVEVFYNPYILKCGHKVCNYCIEQYRKYRKIYQCPLCRKKFRSLCKAKPDKKLVVKLRELYPLQFAQKERSILRLGKETIIGLKFRVTIKNTCKLAYPSQAQVSSSPSRTKFTNTLLLDFPFLSKEEISYLVEKVEFKFPKRFKNRLKVKKKYPFRITEKCTKRCRIRVQIHWMTRPFPATPPPSKFRYRIIPTLEPIPVEEWTVAVETPKSYIFSKGYHELMKVSEKQGRPSDRSWK